MEAEPDGYLPVTHETFVIRVWREASGAAWRGEIVRVSDRASAHFAAFEQAEAFMRRYMNGEEADRMPPIR